MQSEEIRARASRIKLILTDCDGVLTDGKLHYSDAGEALKIFHIHDGLGFKLAQQANIKTGIISGRKSAALALRAQQLSIDYLYHGHDAKLGAFEEIRAAENLQLDEIAYLGDDLHDLDLLHRVGFAVAVANAVAEVKSAAHFITEKSGGEGALREIVECILKAQNKWAEIIKQYN